LSTPSTLFSVFRGRTVEGVKHQLDSTEQELGTSEQRLQFALLEEQLRQIRIRKYGASGEKLSSAQLNLLELEPEVSRTRFSPRVSAKQLPAPPKDLEDQPDRKPRSKAISVKQYLCRRVARSRQPLHL
jgi:hypothetical protein